MGEDTQVGGLMDGQKTVEDYLIDMINAKYARRIMSQLVKEHERNFMELGKTQTIGNTSGW